MAHFSAWLHFSWVTCAVILCLLWAWKTWIGMEGIIWDILWVAVKGQTQIPGLFPLRCFLFYTFRCWACLLFEGLPEPFRAGDLVRPPVQSLKFQVEFHLELSREDCFQFFHVLLAKGDPFVLMCAIEQSRQCCSCL